MKLSLLEAGMSRRDFLKTTGKAIGVAASGLGLGLGLGIPQNTGGVLKVVKLTDPMQIAKFLASPYGIPIGELPMLWPHEWYSLSNDDKIRDQYNLIVRRNHETKISTRRSDKMYGSSTMHVFVKDGNIVGQTEVRFDKRPVPTDIYFNDHDGGISMREIFIDDDPEIVNAVKSVGGEVIPHPKKEFLAQRDADNKKYKEEQDERYRRWKEEQKERNRNREEEQKKKELENEKEQYEPDLWPTQTVEFESRTSRQRRLVEDVDVLKIGAMAHSNTKYLVRWSIGPRGTRTPVQPFFIGPNSMGKILDIQFEKGRHDITEDVWTVTMQFLYGGLNGHGCIGTANGPSLDALVKLYK